MTGGRTPLGWGVALLTAGVVLLLRNTGVIADVAVWPWALLAAGIVLLVVAQRAGGHDRVVPLVLTTVGAVFVLLDLLPTGVGLGPLLLIAAGALLLARGVAAPDRAAASRASLPVDGAASAKVALRYGAGTLRITSGAEPGLLYDGTFAGGLRQQLQRAGDHLDVTLRHARGAPGVLGRAGPLDWHVGLTDAIPLDLEIHTGASRVQLDLGQVRLRSLKIETGASDVDIVLPAHGTSTVDIEAGAADVKVTVPEGVAASVRASTALAAVSIDPTRFPRVNGVHRSAGYDTATDRTDIHLEGGLASFAVQ